MYEDNLRYLYNAPKIIRWKVVASAPRVKLSPLQQYDLVFDKYDLKIRQIKNMCDIFEV